MKEGAERSNGTGACVLPSALTLRENVVDRLVEILLEVNKLSDVVDDPNAHSLSWLRPEVQRIHDFVDGLMKKLTD